ncbi:MAG: hypothetical protein D6813_06265 [Calditrichaeota bacterium]|nr:MAG: hypothetical protein D6813_06265 [Calditrichota bacterium]
MNHEVQNCTQKFKVSCTLRVLLCSLVIKLLKASAEELKRASSRMKGVNVAVSFAIAKKANVDVCVTVQMQNKLNL